MNIIRLIITAILITTPAFSRDFRPETRMENIPAGDSSIQQCVVFRTTAGLRYTVESSTDMSHWATEDEFYGVGNEYVSTLREYTPPPPPPPGTPSSTPPTPAKAASIRLQRASGGGTVASWASLDHGGPVVVSIAIPMDPGWVLIPFYWERYGAYNFYICHPIETVTPPTENSLLGTNDTAMLAVLEASLPAMNQQVAQSVACSRNAPQPGPAAPGSRKFLRLLVDPTVDTDADGSPDWAEFEIAASGTGSMIAGVIGDAFAPDSNSDGIPDGDQLDADQDGTADSKDPNAADNTATFPLGPLPRYAIFPIANAQPAVGTHALQISDKGTVLYENGTWTGGIWTPLATSAEEVEVHARGINDHDQVIGWSDRWIDDPQSLLETICTWSSPDAALSWAVTGAEATEKYAGVPSEGFRWAYLAPGPVLSNDGHFSAFTWSKSGEHYDFTHPGCWKLSSGGQSVTEEGGDHRLDYYQSPGLKWGAGYPLHSPDQGDLQTEEDTSKPVERLIFAPGQLPALSFSPTNVIAYLGGPTIALPAYDGVGQAMAWVNGAWKASETYAGANDISSDGAAIGNTQDGKTAPILLNGKWTGIDRTAPDVAPDWKTEEVTLLDTTPSGWILARRGPFWENNNTVMLPIRAEGQFTDQHGAVILKAAGVDDVSIGSTIPGPEVQDRIWIMAPKGGMAKTVKLKAPLNSKTPLKLSGTGVNFGGADGSATLTAPETLLSITAGSAATGSDIPLELKMGIMDSLSKPLGVKVMKSRTVNVTVHLVTSRVKDADPTKPDKLDPPNFQPTKVQLEKHLDDIYGPQVNARFTVKRNPPVELEWDKATTGDLGFEGLVSGVAVVPGNKRLDLRGGEAGEEENTIDAALTDQAADINVYILGGAELVAYINFKGRLMIAEQAYGLARRVRNIAFIDGDADLYNPLFPNRDVTDELMHTIAHEIGHCIIADGHPDQGGGAATLPGLPVTAHKNRLMVSGTNVNHEDHGKLLVKGEWDVAELWFTNRPLGDN